VQHPQSLSRAHIPCTIYMLLRADQHQQIDTHNDLNLPSNYYGAAAPLTRVKGGAWCQHRLLFMAREDSSQGIGIQHSRVSGMLKLTSDTTLLYHVHVAKGKPQTTEVPEH
jgi:hypothetical protein